MNSFKKLPSPRHESVLSVVSHYQFSSPKTRWSVSKLRVKHMKKRRTRTHSRNSRVSDSKGSSFQYRLLSCRSIQPFPEFALLRTLNRVYHGPWIIEELFTINNKSSNNCNWLILYRMIFSLNFGLLLLVNFLGPYNLSIFSFTLCTNDQSLWTTTSYTGLEWIRHTRVFCLNPGRPPSMVLLLKVLHSSLQELLILIDIYLSRRTLLYLKDSNLYYFVHDLYTRGYTSVIGGYR